MSIPMTLPEPAARPPLTCRVTSVVALALSTVLVHAAPLRCTLAAARGAKRVSRRPATRVEAREAVEAVRWAGRFFPSRAACLETSLAALLVCVAHGRSVDWCIGCRFDPCEAHAWIEADRCPVGEPDTPDRPFYVTLRV